MMGGKGGIEASARDAILASIRENLAAAREELARHGTALPEYTTEPAPGAPSTLEATPHADAFVTILERVGGHVWRVRSEREALDALRAIAERVGARGIACSDDARAARIAAGSGLATLPHDASRAELLDVDLGLSGAQWGIAETGTLVLASDEEKHRVVSLVPPVHVALLEVARIVGTLGDALAALRRDDPSAMSRAITFITGPSRTGDIELTLVVGVHGPKELHVILLDEPPR